MSPDAVWNQYGNLFYLGLLIEEASCASIRPKKVALWELVWCLLSDDCVVTQQTPRRIPETQKIILKIFPEFRYNETMPGTGTSQIQATLASYAPMARTHQLPILCQQVRSAGLHVTGAEFGCLVLKAAHGEIRQLPAAELLPELHSHLFPELYLPVRTGSL